MRHSSIFFVILYVLLTSNFALALDTKRKQVLALESHLAELETHYGLQHEKARDYGVTLEGLRQKYTRLIKRAMTVEEDLGWVPQEQRKILPVNEFRLLMVAMMAEFRDGHANSFPPNYESWGLGLLTGVLDGRLFITGIQSDLIRRRSGPREVRVGDEVISINGESVEEVAKRNLPYAQTSVYNARWRHALTSVLDRHSKISRPVVEGDEVRLTLKRKDETFDVHLNWVNTFNYRRDRDRYPNHFDTSFSRMNDVEIPNTPYGVTGVVSSVFRQGVLKLGLPIIDVGQQLNHEISSRQARAMAGNATGAEVSGQATGAASIEGGLEASAGASKGFPTLAINRLQVYIVRFEDKNILVIRVPSYSSPNMVQEVQWLYEAVRRGQEFADGVFLDVIDNAGGAVWMGTRLLAMLAGKEALKSISSNTLVTDTLLHSNVPSGKTKNWDLQAPMNYGEELLSDLEFEEYKAVLDRGEKWSGFKPAFGNVFNRTGYGLVVPDTELSLDLPLLVGNNSLSASGGDFIPREAQASKRALVFGDKSQGLGAPVYRKIDSMPGSQMSFRCPMSVCIAADGQPIEGMGTVPNLSRPVMPYDLEDGFRSYAEDALKMMVGVIKGKSEAELQQALRERLERRGNVDRSKIKEAREYLELLGRGAEFLVKEEMLEHSLPMLKRHYQEAALKLKELGKDFNREEWQSLRLPIPEALIGSDRFWPSLWQKGETVDRITDFERLEAWRETPRLELARAVASALREIPGDIRTADPCSLLLFKRE